MAHLVEEERVAVPGEKIDVRSVLDDLRERREPVRGQVDDEVLLEGGLDQEGIERASPSAPGGVIGGADVVRDTSTKDYLGDRRRHLLGEPVDGDDRVGVSEVAGQCTTPRVGDSRVREVAEG